MATYLAIYNAFQQGGDLRARAAVAVAKFAAYILSEDPAAPNHANRKTWAAAALVDAPGEVNRLAWGIAGDQLVLDSGDALSDAQVQGVVEYYINLIRITPA